jgi:CHASE3 domain sensor protein
LRYAEGLVSVVCALLGFRLLITAFQKLRRLLQRRFEQAQQLPVDPDQLTGRIAALMVG